MSRLFKLDLPVELKQTPPSPAERLERRSVSSVCRRTPQHSQFAARENAVLDLPVELKQTPPSPAERLERRSVSSVCRRTPQHSQFAARENAVVLC
uniref:Uncharacterized protein n=1 Tax=Ascaris lumbricoides TaxID=6252 RepID=A0A0M3IQY3_ASCLU